jgi:hypothetical protein
MKNWGLFRWPFPFSVKNKLHSYQILGSYLNSIAIFQPSLCHFPQPKLANSCGGGRWPFLPIVHKTPQEKEISCPESF